MLILAPQQSKQTKLKFDVAGSKPDAATLNPDLPGDPIGFIRRFVGIDDIASAYDFSMAQVYIIQSS